MRLFDNGAGATVKQEVTGDTCEYPVEIEYRCSADRDGVASIAD
ncbi:MAG: hypothetical protein NTX48_13665 [Planctomycetales bacterium]|nr:hypothetical protein [Planctomycetales bacterium]